MIIIKQNIKLENKSKLDDMKMLKNKLFLNLSSGTEKGEKRFSIHSSTTQILPDLEVKQNK